MVTQILDMCVKYGLKSLNFLFFILQCSTCHEDGVCYIIFLMFYLLLRFKNHAGFSLLIIFLYCNIKRVQCEIEVSLIVTVQFFNQNIWHRSDILTIY